MIVMMVLMLLMVMIVATAALVVMIVMMMLMLLMVMIVAAAALAVMVVMMMAVLLLLEQLSRQRIASLDRFDDLLTGQLIPRSRDDDSIRILLADQLCCLQLLLLRELLCSA